MAIYPITETGSTTTALTYGEGDFIGVETSATSSTDHLGFNEAADFTVRLDTELQNEHFANGVHNTPRIARGILVATWDGIAYTVEDASYHQTSAGVVTRGAAAWTVGRAAAGDLTVTVNGGAMSGGSPIMIADLTPMEVEETTGNAVRVYVKRYTYTDSTHFGIRRYSGADISSLAFSDGFFIVAVYV